VSSRGKTVADVESFMNGVVGIGIAVVLISLLAPHDERNAGR
jgi:hypothetical protein